LEVIVRDSYTYLHFHLLFFSQQKVVVVVVVDFALFGQIKFEKNIYKPIKATMTGSF
jgi:hypothetical protein